MTKKQKKKLTRIIISAAGIIIANILSRFLVINGESFTKLLYGIPLALLFVSIYIIIGGDILRKAFKGILNRQIFDENFLMTIATLGAFALAIYEGSGDYNEAIAVMLFYQIENYSRAAQLVKAAKT